MEIPDIAVLRYVAITGLHQTPVILSRRCLRAHNAPMLGFEFASGAAGVFRKPSQQSGNNALTRAALPVLMVLPTNRGCCCSWLSPCGRHRGQGGPCKRICHTKAMLAKSPPNGGEEFGSANAGSNVSDNGDSDFSAMDYPRRENCTFLSLPPYLRSLRLTSDKAILLLHFSGLCPT